MFVRFSSVAGERGAADAERDIRGTALSEPFRWVVVRGTASPIVVNLPDDTWPQGGIDNQSGIDK